MSTWVPVKTSTECICFIKAQTHRFTEIYSYGWQLSQYLSCSVSSCHNIDFCKLEEVISDDIVQQSLEKFFFFSSTALFLIYNLQMYFIYNLQTLHLPSLLRFTSWPLYPDKLLFLMSFLALKLLWDNILDDCPASSHHWEAMMSLWHMLVTPQPS